MQTQATFQVNRGRVRHSEMGAALVLSEPDLTAPQVLCGADGATCYLPAYRAAAQHAGGQEAFATRLDPDGTLTIFLSLARPEALRADRSGAHPRLQDTAFGLCFAQGQQGLPLQAAFEGDSVRLWVRLAGEDLVQVRSALFDTDPNVWVQVRHKVRLACPQTRAFVERNWHDDGIRAGLLGLFGGIPFASASSYFQMASAADPDFANQYLLLDGEYLSTAAVLPLPGYIQWQIECQGRVHNYYQDNRERSRIFYLPDRFELAAGPEGAPSLSLLQFSLPPDGGPVGDAQAVFRIFGNPVVDPLRIAAASKALSERIGTAVQMASLEDGNGVRKRFIQYLPNVQASNAAGIPSEQAHASIDLARGLRNELDLNFTQFRALWACIFSQAPEKTLFRGWVDVELADGRFTERIEFVGRLPQHRQASFFDDILDTSSTNTYPLVLSIHAMDRVFAQPSGILEVGLKFSNKTTVLLSPGQTTAEVSMERSIRDIVLGNQVPERYAYHMRVVREDGNILHGEFSEDSDNPSLWITPKMVDDCVNDGN